jgi:hypothetical protein
MKAHNGSAKCFVTVMSTALLLGACGGGGGGGDAAPITPANTQPLTIADTQVALKVAATMVTLGPQGGVESRTRVIPREAWKDKSGTYRDICRTYVVTNADGVPSVGDSSKVSWPTGCAFRHATGATLTDIGEATHQITVLTDPATLVNGAWQYEDRITNSSTQTRSFFLVGGAYTFDGTATGNYSIVNQIDHRADDSQNDHVEIQSSTKETATLGNSDVTARSIYTCRYGAGLTTLPDCSDVGVNLTGKVLGVTVNSTLTQISKAPVIFQIADGTSKITVELTSDNPNYFKSTFLVTTPTGTKVTVTGEDMNWMGLF